MQRIKIDGVSHVAYTEEEVSYIKKTVGLLEKAIEEKDNIISKMEVKA